MPRLTKANSPPAPSNSPISTATATTNGTQLCEHDDHDRLERDQADHTPPASNSGSRSSTRTSIFMPTVEEKIPATDS
jgi:hypothetical protein